MRVMWDYRRTVLCGAIALVALVIVAVWAYKNEWLIHRGNTPQGAEHPTVVHQPLTPSSLDQVHAWFGPWTTIDSGLVNPGRLVLIQADGSTRGSSWAASIDNQWTTSDIPQIDQLSYAGQFVEFTTGGLATYKVAYRQPFVLEQLPDRVFAFVNNNGKHVIMSSSVRYVKRTGYKP